MEAKEVQSNDGIFIPRGYQLEMLEASLAGNIIIAMDTGSGKTPIAVLRIAAELERCPTHKSVWFLCPKVALAQQQFRVLRKMLPGTPCKVLVGSDGYNLWSSQTIWDEVLLNARVVVCTPEILYDALSHGFVKISGIALLVFDEAHYCKDKHPANRIMAGFYHPDRLQGKEIPHILGLTASPTFGNGVLGLETIEKNLNAICRTPRFNLEELLKHTHQPLLIQQKFACNPVPNIPLFDSLMREFGMENIHNDPYIKQLKARKNANPQELNKAILQGKTPCRDQLKTLIEAARTVHMELGPWACEHYLLYSIAQFQNKHNELFNVGSLDPAESKYLSSFFERLATAAVLTLQSPGPRTVTDKVNILIEILRKELSITEGSGNHDHIDFELTGIVFVETRIVVCMLKRVLENHPSVNIHLQLGLSFGSSAHPKRKGMICDYIMKDKSIEPIEDVLNDLRFKEKNLLISTNVVEEGIDITACNTVICFDESQNLVSFVQRRGRARDSKSKYYIMHSEHKKGGSISKWLELEKEMKAKYMDHMRGLSELQAQELLQQGDREYLVDSTGARLTLHDSLSHLHHFCNMLGVVRYASSAPLFVFKGDTEGGNGICQVILPTSVNESLRTFESSKQWTTERLLRADAAFEACKALHQAGLLNDHMLPVKDLSEEELTMYQVVEKRPNVVAVNQTFSPWSEVLQASQNCHEYFQRSVIVRENDKVVIEMNLLMARMPLSIQDVNLYIDAQTTLNISFGEVLPAKSLNLATAEKFTKAMLYSIFRARMNLAEALFPIYFMPIEKLDKSWLLQKAKAIDLTSLSTPTLDRNLGLIRDASGRPFVLHGVQEVDNVDEITGIITRKNMIKASTLPKRYDFVHSDSVMSHAKTSNAVFLDPEACTMDQIPLRYAQFGKFVPYIQHNIHNALLVERLNSTILAPASISSLPLIFEAISTPIAQENVDYQRMEFLGDAVFKFYTAVTLMAQHLNYPEGYLAYTKDLIVSNKSAALAAKELGLDRFIVRNRFTDAKWRPLRLNDIQADSNDNQDTCTDELSTKVLADVVEALIGLAYLDGQGAESKILAMLNIFTYSGLRQKITWEPLANLRHNLRSVVPELDLIPPVVRQIQAITGYTFKLPALAIEAVTHPGHLALKSDPLGSQTDYQRLEFLGDAVLDMIVTRFIYSYNESTPVPRMHLLRTAAVNKDTLGYFALGLSIEIDMSEPANNAGTSSKDNPGDIKPSKLLHRATQQISLIQLLRHIPSEQLAENLSKLQQRYQDLDADIKHALNHGQTYPWTLLAALDIEKLTSDMIEAIIGAIYIDSDGDLDVCEAWISRIGILPWLKRAMAEDVKVLHPKEELGMITDTGTLRYQVTQKPGQQERFQCTLFVAEKEICLARGSTRRIAEMRAAEIALELLAEPQESRVGGVTGSKAHE